MRKKILVIAASCTLFLTGCSDNMKKHEYKVQVEDYQRTTYDTEPAKRQDIDAVLSISVNATVYEKKGYQPMYDEMEVDKVNFSDGDSFKKGDVLVAFKSKEIQEEIEGYQNSIAETNLLIEHYKEVSKYDTEQDYSTLIKQLEEQVGVDSTYVSELKAKEKSYSIVAEQDGVIMNYADILLSGKVNSTDTVVTVLYGNGEYEGTTDSDYEFVIGKEYTAVYGTVKYSFRLDSISEEDGKKKLSFTDVSTEAKASRFEMLTVEIPLEPLKNVIAVPDNCVKKLNIDGEKEKYIIYVINDDGYREAREVLVGQSRDGLTVITSGLEEGEMVVK